MGESGKEFEKARSEPDTSWGGSVRQATSRARRYFWLTDDSGWVTGAEIPVSGGIRV